MSGQPSWSWDKVFCYSLLIQQALQCALELGWQLREVIRSKMSIQNMCVWGGVDSRNRPAWLHCQLEDCCLQFYTTDVFFWPIATTEVICGGAAKQGKILLEFLVVIQYGANSYCDHQIASYNFSHHLNQTLVRKKMTVEMPCSASWSFPFFSVQLSNSCQKKFSIATRHCWVIDTFPGQGPGIQNDY